mmetsp:Transcript_30059/g.44380  ORF Transcript_30059/g.44380 Transcript_30059/m.44380 type:complete len:127 (-) Transcript_30059:43-423(-)
MLMLSRLTQNNDLLVFNLQQDQRNWLQKQLRPQQQHQKLLLKHKTGRRKEREGERASVWKERKNTRKTTEDRTEQRELDDIVETKIDENDNDDDKRMTGSYTYAYTKQLIQEHNEHSHTLRFCVLE